MMLWHHTNSKYFLFQGRGICCIQVQKIAILNHGCAQVTFNNFFRAHNQSEWVIVTNNVENCDNVRACTQINVKWLTPGRKPWSEKLCTAIIHPTCLWPIHEVRKDLPITFQDTLASCFRNTNSAGTVGLPTTQQFFDARVNVGE